MFVPCAFISGITGQFFRQFAVTIAVSTVISAFNSLTLSPALARDPAPAARAAATRSRGCSNCSLGWFFRLFNARFRHWHRGATRVLVGRIAAGQRDRVAASTAGCCG